jgi:hypothetical protein
VNTWLSTVLVTQSSSCTCVCALVRSCTRTYIEGLLGAGLGPTSPSTTPILSEPMASLDRRLFAEAWDGFLLPEEHPPYSSSGSFEGNINLNK